MKKRKDTAKRRALEIASKTHRAFHTPIQIEEYLRRCIKNGGKTFFLEVQQVGPDALGIEIKPMLGDDPNNVYLGYVMRFNIEPKKAIDNLMKYLREKPINERIS